MRQIIRAAFAASLCTLALATSGCTARTIISFEDHPKHPVTHLEVFETKNYVFYTSHEHQFFTCSDAGDQLVCKRDCGSEKDIVCPSEVSSGRTRSTNVR